MSRDAEAATPPPRTIGRYRLGRAQGTGLFGTVWLAQDTTTGRPVAVRLFPPELTETANVAETMRRRTRAVVEASRAHPGLVRVLEYGATEDGRLYAVMDRVEGRHLNEVLAARPRPDMPEVLRLALEVGGPVETLHNMGLLHGGLRLRNVAVADGRVTLMDVETIVLRDAPALQPIVAARSRAEYLAPEQLQGRPISEKTDVYAFALMLYEMISGRPPFGGSTREAIVDRQLEATPPPLRRSQRAVPVSVEATLAEALEKRPEQRPFMPELLNHLANEAGSVDLRWKRAAAVAAAVLVVGAALGVLHVLTAPPEVAVPAIAAPAPGPAGGDAPPPPSVAERAPAPADAGGVPVVTPVPTEAMPPVLTLAPGTPDATPAHVTPGGEASPTSIDPVPPGAVPVRPDADASAVAPARPSASAVAAPPASSPARRAAMQAAPALPTLPRPAVSGLAASRPASASSPDEPDPTAIIDWLLKRRND